MKHRTLILLVLLFGSMMPYVFSDSLLSAQTYGTHYSPAAGSRSGSSQRGIALAPEGMTAFRSTSSMPLSGSALPMAAATGTTVAIWGTGPLRDDFFGDETIDNIQNPNQPGTPIGDTPWILFGLMLGGYAVVKRRRGIVAPERREE